MERTEPPTTGRIEELRDEGKVAYSPFAARCGSVFLVLIAFLGERDRLAQLVGDATTLVASPSLNSPISSATTASLVEGVLFILLVTAVASLVGTVMIGLVQTRFMFHFKLISPSFGRLNPFRVVGIFEILGRICMEAIIVAAVFLVAFLGMRIVLPSYLALLNFAPGTLTIEFVNLFFAVFPLIVTILGMVGFLAWLLARNKFLRTHRMTRQQVLQENTER